MPSRIDALGAAAPDLVHAWRGIDEGGRAELRRRVAAAGGIGSTARVLPQLAAAEATLAEVVATLPDAAFQLPGGEGEWTVAEAIGHVANARSGLAMAGALAASGRWPADAGTVVPGVPGPPGSGRDELLRRLAASGRVVERAARSIAGHEAAPCPLEHPLVGRLRCGEWLVFAGVHDVMHLDQLEGIEASLAEAAR